MSRSERVGRAARDLLAAVREGYTEPGDTDPGGEIAAGVIALAENAGVERGLTIGGVLAGLATLAEFEDVDEDTLLDALREALASAHYERMRASGRVLVWAPAVRGVA